MIISTFLLSDAADLPAHLVAGAMNELSCHSLRRLIEQPSLPAQVIDVCDQLLATRITNVAPVLSLLTSEPMRALVQQELLTDDMLDAVMKRQPDAMLEALANMESKMDEVAASAQAVLKMRLALDSQVERAINSLPPPL